MEITQKETERLLRYWVYGNVLFVWNFMGLMFVYIDILCMGAFLGCLISYDKTCDAPYPGGPLIIRQPVEYM